MSYDREVKGIRLLQERAGDIHSAHEDIASDLDQIKQRLMELDGAPEILLDSGLAHKVKSVPVTPAKPLTQTPIAEIYAEAEQKYGDKLSLGDILDVEGFAAADARVDGYVEAFNQEYGLDKWDYAMAGVTGVLASLVDVFLVQVPKHPGFLGSAASEGGWLSNVIKDGFGKILTPEKIKALEDSYKVSYDISRNGILGESVAGFGPRTHRLHSLGHDPILGWIFGVRDILSGGITTLGKDGQLIMQSVPGCEPAQLGWDLFSKIINALKTVGGHMASDVATPAGLPPPLFAVTQFLQFGDYKGRTVAELSQSMYRSGYDFRHFMASSVPTTIMEALLRAIYAGKQAKVYDAPFGKSFKDTMPLGMSPRFRMILAMAYGSFSMVNAGKVYATQNILNANYAAWSGLAWNGIHALRWALLEKHLKLWGEVEAKEIERIENLVQRMDILQARAKQLPTY